MSPEYIVLRRSPAQAGLGCILGTRRRTNGAARRHLGGRLTGPAPWWAVVSGGEAEGAEGGVGGGEGGTEGGVAGGWGGWW